MRTSRRRLYCKCDRRALVKLWTLVSLLVHWQLLSVLVLVVVVVVVLLLWLRLLSMLISSGLLPLP